MNEESKEYPFIPIIFGICTALTCAVLSLNFHWLGLMVSSLGMFTGVSLVIAAGLGYLAFAVTSKNERYRELLDSTEYHLAEVELAREYAEHERQRDHELLNALSRCVSGVLFRYEVPGFKERGQFRFIGDEIAALTGHCAEDMIEQPKLFWDAIHAEDVEDFLASIKAAEEAKAGWEHTFRLLTQSGQTKLLQVKAVYNDTRERPCCFDGIIVDVTAPLATASMRPAGAAAEQKLTELTAQLERAVARADDMALKVEKAKLENEGLIQSFSHEVRTTVNGVQGILDMLAEKQLNQPQHDCVTEARNTLRSLVPVIGHLIDHAHLRAGELVLEHAPFNPKALLEDTVAMFEVEARRDNIKLETAFDEQIPTMLEGDAARIRQVLFSLLSNAMHYTSTGTITTEFYCSGRAGKNTFVRFHVRDTGHGMSGDIKAKFFKKSVVLNHEKSKSLGLPLCSNLIEQMGGKLSVKSKEGSGSDVYFVLRLKDVSASFIAASAPGDDVEVFQPLHILAAEDVLANQRVCKYRVEALGHQITIVNNGKQALQALEKEEFDAVLMDCEMPVMDGFAATEAIRNQAHPVKNPEIYIIAATARSDRASILESGMNEYLSKPFNKEELEEVMHRIANYNCERGFGFVLPQQQTVVTREGRGSRAAEASDLSSQMSSDEMEALLSLTQAKKPE